MSRLFQIVVAQPLGNIAPPAGLTGRTIGQMTSRSSASQKTRKLSPEEEAFASWFVKWWQRRGRHIDFSANAVPDTQKKSPAASEIEIWRDAPDTD
jgi:hypothetical protein